MKPAQIISQTFRVTADRIVELETRLAAAQAQLAERDLRLIRTERLLRLAAWTMAVVFLICVLSTILT